MKRELIVSVDVEALPARLSQGVDPVEALVWGRFPGLTREYGMGEMMRMADVSGIPLTMFLELAGLETYGESVEIAGNSVLRAGHDLQMHVHPEILGDEFWRKLGLRKPTVRPKEYNDRYARAFVEYFTEEFREKFGSTPTAYRGGSFTFTRQIFDAVTAQGIAVSSNHAYATFLHRELPPLGTPTAGVFLWEGGMCELPITQVADGSQWFSLAIPWPKKLRRSISSLLEQESKRSAKSGPAVMLLHSWSMLEYGQGKRFWGGSDYRREKLVSAFTRIADLFEPITVSTFHERLKAGSYDVGAPKRYPS